MKLFIYRYTKLVFIYLRLHKLFGLLSGFCHNLYYMIRLSAWAARNRKVAYNDFPCKWDYHKRYQLYQHVLTSEGLLNEPVNYIEFGVAGGESIRWFSEKNKQAGSRFYGFDTFTGLPEDWGPFKKGAFGTNNQIPEINDVRVQFYKGLFQQTVPGFLKQLDNSKRNIIMLDADLFSATLYALTSMAPYLKENDIVFFDEFAVPTHEFKAYEHFVQSYYANLQLIAAANNYYFVAFKVK